jgi:hypothetical protein
LNKKLELVVGKSHTHLTIENVDGANTVNIFSRTQATAESTEKDFHTNLSNKTATSKEESIVNAEKKVSIMVCIMYVLSIFEQILFIACI